MLNVQKIWDRSFRYDERCINTHARIKLSNKFGCDIFETPQPLRLTSLVFATFINLVENTNPYLNKSF